MLLSIKVREFSLDPENLHREADPISGPGVYTRSTLRRWYFVHADRMRFDHAEVPPRYRRIKRSCSAYLLISL